MQKITSLENIRSLIQHRYEEDKILGLYTAVTLLGINFILILLFEPAGITYFFPFGNYPIYFLTFGLNLSITAVFFIVIYRVPEHAARDNAIIDSAKGCLQELGIEGVEDLERFRDSTWKYRIYTILSFIFLAVPLVLIPIRMHYFYGNEFTGLTSLLVYFGAPILYALVCAYPIFIFPLRHDRRFVAFTERFSELLIEKGYILTPFKPAVGKKLRIVIILYPITFVAFMGIFLTMLYGSGGSADPWIAVVLGIFYSYPYLAFVMLLAASSLNQHILHQWAYEEYLISALDGFYNPSTSVVKETEYSKEKVREIKRIPLILRIAEIFLVIICILYNIKIFASGVDFDMGRYGEWGLTADCARYVILTVMYELLFVITVDALFSLRSKNLKSFRKVVRSCLTFSISVAVTALLTEGSYFSNYFELNPFITIALLYVLLIMVLTSDAVKWFYTPYGMVSPPTKEWARFALYGKLEFEPADADDTTVMNDNEGGQ